MTRQITRIAPRQLYRLGQPNWCACCGSTAWIVGRFSAECARCHAAFEIADQAIGKEAA